ncbi:MAG: ferrochelatase [Owenweeksia sp.]
MAKHAALLVNLGSPDSYEVPDVKVYLREFLMDKRVIDYPWFFRFLLIEGIILRTRPPKSAEAYKSIWWDEGSPLIVLSRKLQESVQKHTNIPVGLGMRYGNPSIEHGLKQLVLENPDLKEVKLIPLYPHYAMSSFETVVVKAREVVEKYFKELKLKVQDPFYKDQDYITALSKSLSVALVKEYDHVLFSYHGIPERHIRKSDITGNHCLKSENCCSTDSPAHAYCYRHQVFKTTELVVKELGIPEGKYSNSFQSRLDDKWLRPFTDKQLAELPKRGIKKLIVLCPAFVSDCLETIEEIGEEGREIFIEAGGEGFILVPCLNDQDDWVKVVANWCEND